MAANLKEFLEQLASDDAFRARYAENPNQVIRESNLSAEEESLLKEGDETKIRDHLGDDAPGFLILDPGGGD